MHKIAKVLLIYGYIALTSNMPMLASAGKPAAIASAAGVLVAAGCNNKYHATLLVEQRSIQKAVENATVIIPEVSNLIARYCVAPAPWVKKRDLEGSEGLWNQGIELSKDYTKLVINVGSMRRIVWFIETGQRVEPLDSPDTVREKSKNKLYVRSGDRWANGTNKKKVNGDCSSAIAIGEGDQVAPYKQLPCEGLHLLSLHVVMQHSMVATFMRYERAQSNDLRNPYGRIISYKTILRFINMLSGETVGEHVVENAVERVVACLPHNRIATKKDDHDQARIFQVVQDPHGHCTVQQEQEILCKRMHAFPTVSPPTLAIVPEPDNHIEIWQEEECSVCVSAHKTVASPEK